VGSAASVSAGEFHLSGPHFAAVGSFLESLAFVVLFAAFAESESKFDEAALEEDGEGNEREAVVFAGFGEFADFAAVEEQFAFALSGVVVDAGFGVFGDVAVDEPDFVAFDAGVGFFDGDFVIADAFDFAAGEHDAAVDFVEDVVFVSRAAVGADDLAI
jgi:hypothetical protein